MPWYFKEDWQANCSAPGCTKPATGWLHNAQNGPVAPYCTTHGERKAKEANAR